jgi:BolA family transcriptional regulator, general stress-responsive regulator
MTRPRVDRMRERLTTSLQPQMLDIEDESHLHVGHIGARDGRGHFRVIIVADAFDGLTRVQRHQKIYAALGDLMQTDIHALAVQALTPAEL